MDEIQNSKENICGLGNVLKSLRIVQNLSVKELSEKLGLSSTYICDLEANRKRPSLDLLDKYSKVLGVHRSTLLYFDEEGKKNNYDHKKLLFSILKVFEEKNIMRGETTQ